MIHPAIYIDKTKKMGWGVFTAEKIEAGTIVEISPVIIMTADERKLIDRTILHDYIFEWGPKSEQCCMATGYVPVYNHSYTSNCEYDMDFNEEVITIATMRDIEKGEELFINYNGNWDEKKPVWFITG